MTPTAALADAGIEFVVHTHPPIRTEADLHLTGLDPRVSVKTLAFEVPDGSVVLVGMPGLWRARYGAIAQAVGVSRSQLRPAGPDRLRSLGMEPGGVSPVCADQAVIVVLDASLPASGQVYCGGGTSETTLQLDADDILRVAARGLVAAVAEPQPAR
ncbi:MAG: YbaK/EbsC family protein [Propionicimonas sp.]|nr:YbaK/EbsC family protein [Propionicimonas sp.]